MTSGILYVQKADIASFRHPLKKGTVTIAGNLGTAVPIGTLNSALKQAGLKE